MTWLVPELTFIGGQPIAGLAVRLDQDGPDGVIGAVTPVERLTAEPILLRRRALLPGFVNTHSHAFQRAIRGRTHTRSPGRPDDDFWTWRTAMYGAAAALDPEALAAVSRYAFIEMLLAGYTTVGEFHYLHRDPGGQERADPNELSLTVVDAAREAGMRICLLRTAYLRGGPGAPPQPEQLRFVEPSMDACLRNTDDLRTTLARRGDPLATAGIAPHSVRAVEAAAIREASEWAKAASAPMHMHVSEQLGEIDACQSEHGRRPVELLAHLGALGPHLTAVHATHLTPEEVGLLGQAGVTVCACPTTEADLGDGILRASDLVAADVPLALGSDSHAVIDPFTEMRSLEVHERLRLRRRNALVEAPPGLEVAPLLLSAGGRNGARALGLESGLIEAGRPADLVAVDLDHPALAGHRRDTLAACLALSASASVVTDVWVAGRHVVQDRSHAGLDAARRELEQAVLRL